MLIAFGSRTDVGKVRKNNQDNLTTVMGEGLGGRADGLFIVADGMGGHAGGEIASRIAVDTVPAVVGEELARLNGQLTTETLADSLRVGLSAANEAVYKQARANPELRGMGTTCVAALAREGAVAVGNVGDSRAYLLRGGRLRQITDDHSLVQEHVRAGEMTAEEARESRYKNVITRGIGLASRVEPDVDVLEMEEGDTLLLCSDGLSGMVPDQDIESVLASEADPQTACDRLVDLANANGGADNVTAIVVRHGEVHPAAAPSRHAAPALAVDSISVQPTPRPKWPAYLLAAVSLLLCALLVVVGRETYELTPAPPFVRHKPAPSPVPAAQPAKPVNLATLAYGSPVVLSTKQVRPSPLTCDSLGSVYAITKLTGTTIRISADGQTVSEFPTRLQAPDESAVSFAADSQGNLYVSSRADHAIRKYTPTGTRVAEVGRDDLIAPGAVAVDAAGSIYVVDDSIVKVFRPGAPHRPVIRLTAPRGPILDSQSAVRNRPGDSDGAR
jgi:serine/threonine protein phosphatase PrpC